MQIASWNISFRPNIWRRRNHYKWQDGIYSLAGGSDKKISKHNCPTCGVPIFIKPEVLGGIVYVPVGLLTPDYDFKPKVKLWAGGRPQWMSQAPTIVESFSDSGTIERIQLILGNLYRRA